jgi:hypothetical protein
MKLQILALILGMALETSCSSVPRSSIRYSAPSVTPVRTTVTKVQATVTTARTQVASAQTHASQATATIKEIAATETVPALLTLAQAAAAQVDQLTSDLLDAQTSLTIAQGDLAATQVKVTDLEGKVGVQTEQLNTATDEKNAAIAQDAVDRKHAHKLKFYACSLGAAAAGFLVFQFRTVLAFLGPYGFAAYVAVPALVFGALWLIL